MDWAIFQQFVRWNVRRAWRDPQLERARVYVSGGKITRI
jgi:hypothetical protein